MFPKYKSTNAEKMENYQSMLYVHFKESYNSRALEQCCYTKRLYVLLYCFTLSRRYFALMTSLSVEAVEHFRLPLKRPNVFWMMDDIACSVH